MTRRKQSNPKSLKSDVLTEITENTKIINEILTAKVTVDDTDNDLHLMSKSETRLNKNEEILNMQKIDIITPSYELPFRLKTNNIEIDTATSSSDEESSSDSANSSMRNKIKRLKTCNTNTDRGSCRDFGSVKAELTEKNSPCQFLKSGSAVIIETKKPSKEEELTGIDNEDVKTMNATSILINGKRYYPLIFSCDSCGLRYSDQSTLMIHKQNYCSKRPIPSSNSSNSSLSYCSSDSSRSNSRSPNRTTNNRMDDQIKNQQPKQVQVHFENSFVQNNRNDEQLCQKTDVQLMKSTLYQCNSCLFQTDKKSIMNRHSRVHLAQKRKSMERLCSDNSYNYNVEESKLKKFPLSDETTSCTFQQQEQLKILNKSEIGEKKDQNDSKPDSNQNHSYCSDCDIQFSSIITFQHHRSNYCQKYKTIEAIVHVDLKNGNKMINHGSIIQESSNNQIKPQMININKEAKTKFVQNTSNKVLTQPINNHIINNLQSNTFAPDNKTNSLGSAVRMGDMVYLPLFKLPFHDDQKKIQNFEQSEQTIKCPSNEELMLKHFMQSNTKLLQQLNSVQTNQQTRINNETDLEATLKKYQQLIAMSDTAKISTQTFKSEDLSKKSSSKSTTKNNCQYEVVQHQPINSPNLENAQIQDQTRKPISSCNFSNPNNSYSGPFEALHLRFIQQKIEEMKNSPSDNLLTSPLNPRFPLLGYLPEKTPVTLAPDTSQSVQNKIYHCRSCQQFFLKLKQFEDHTCNNVAVSADSCLTKLPSTHSGVADKLLSLPDVKNQSIEMNIHSNIDESLLTHPLVKKTIQETYFDQSNKNLNNNSLESYFFICTTCGYRGNTARGVKQHGKLHLAQLEQFAVINISNRAKIPILVYDSSDDSEIQTHENKNVNKNYDLEESLSEKHSPEIEDNSIENKPKFLMSSSTNVESSVPFSKKARILDLHYNQQKTLSIQESDKQESANNIKLEKSQSYCSKCNIQFRHKSNYLAHKKLYCK